MYRNGNILMYLESNERAINTSLVIRIVTFSDYDFNTNPGNIHYELIEYKEEFCYDENTGDPVIGPDGKHSFLIFKTPIDSKLLPLTWEVVNSWGADDQVVFDYIIENLPK